MPLSRGAIAALDELPRRLDTRLLFPAAGGAHVDLDNWRRREWKPALEAAGVDHRHIYDHRHIRISKEGEDLVLKYEGNFQGQAFNAKINLTPDAEKLKVAFDIMNVDRLPIDHSPTTHPATANRH